MAHRSPTWRAWVFLATLFLAASLGAVALRPESGARAAGAAPARCACRAELRSWVVAGRGRHLYLDVKCEPSDPMLERRVEYSTLIHRADYRYTRDASGQPRLGRLRGPGVLRPPSFSGPPDDRLEAVYELTCDQARALQRDRVFDVPYVLLGSNSNSGLRRAMEEAGLGLPAHVIGGGGLLGEFPGIDMDAGRELPRGEWGRFGLVGER